MTIDQFNGWLADPRRPPLVMGILNVTPDSFSDGGRFASTEAAIAHAQTMSPYAQIIDIGGESTRPGAAPVEPEEQIRRILPVIQAIAGRFPMILSVDTTSAQVAQAALDAGCHLINDISSGRFDAKMLPLAARREAPIILMHMLGIPATMQEHPIYLDVVAEVRDFLSTRAQAAMDAGVDRANILVDAGFGFGKTLQHNLQLLRGLGDLASLGYPLVVGTSRKGFIGTLTDESNPVNRVFGTAATVAWALANGAAIVRVHDVKAIAQVVRTIRAIDLGDLPSEQ